MLLARKDREGRRRRQRDTQRTRFRSRRRCRTPSGVPTAVNLAPMIDVTFLLLIFFLVTTTFERAEGILASDLPEIGAVPAVPLPVSPIVVRIARTGPGDDDYAIRIDRFEARPDDFESLPDFLRRIQQQPGFDTQTPIVIVAENDVRWDHVVSCWNAAIRAGCERIAFGEP